MKQAQFPTKNKHSSYVGRLTWQLALILLVLFGLQATFFAVQAHAQSAQETANSDKSGPDPVVLALTRAKELRVSGRMDEALVMLNKALETAPRDLQLRFLRALVLVDLKRSDEAIVAFETLSQEFPELGEPYNNLAVLFAGRGELDKARAALERAISAQPNYALAHENLGDIYVRLAEQAYQRASEKAPTSVSAKKKLGLAKDWVKTTESQP